VDHLCQFVPKPVHSFSKYHVDKIGNERTDGRTNGQVENIMMINYDSGQSRLVEVKKFVNYGVAKYSSSQHVCLWFLPRDVMHERGHMPSCGVCVSVRLPITFVCSVETNKYIFKHFYRRVATPLYRVFQKSCPLKLFWNIFTSAKSFCMKFCKCVGNLFTSTYIYNFFCRFILIFH